jgi:hypothetical protein
MIATFFTPRDDPYGTISFLAGMAVIVTLVSFVRSPDKMSRPSRMFAAIMTAMLLPAAVAVLCLDREDAHGPGIDRMEAFVSFFVLISGAFGAGLGCTRSDKRWLILEGLIVSVLAGAIIIWLAADMRLIFWVRVDTPALTAATIVLVLATFAFRLTGLLRRLRRSTKPE